MLPVRSIRSDRFVSQQLQMVFISLSVFLLSALILVPLANRILRPVKKLTTALYDLATGQYGTRVEVKAGYELGKLVDDFNCLALALEKNRQERFQYAADVSHELLTPLSTLRAEIEAILEGVHQATADSVGSLHNKVMQLSRLVDDLYQSSLADVGMISYHPEIQPIADILVKSLNSFRIDYAIKGIELQIDMPAPNDYTVYADGNRLRQLFDNLLKNSVKYTSPGGMLMIRMECRDNVIAIDFQDSDPGVPPSDLVRIFDRQFRGSKSGDKAGGAGLGLAICKSIVEVHGGSIRAHSSPLGGLWIRIEMPIMGG